METVLVTGGAGFIGSHITDILVEKNYNVRIVDNLVEQVHQGEEPEYLNEDANLLKSDVRDKETWERELEYADAIIHLAGRVGVGQSMHQPVEYLESNSLGTGKLYKTLIESELDLEKIVIASSMTVYGEGVYECEEHGDQTPPPRTTEQMEKGEWELKCEVCGRKMDPKPTQEDKPPQNLSVYSLTKYNQERLAMMFSKSLSVPTTVLRPFNVYGPRQSLDNPYTGVTAIFSSRIKNGNPPKIYEDGKQTRDFIYVEDVARAFVKALESQNTGIYNVGSGDPTSIKKVAEILIDLYDKDLDPIISGEFRPMDLRHCYADTTKILEEMDFKPKIGLKEGFGKLVEWGRKQESKDMFEKAEEESKDFIRKKTRSKG